MKDVRNLPFALNHPIFIFNSKTQPTSKVVITDLKSNNVNLLIALQIDFKEKDAIVISIRSIYPKESQQSILNWVNEGLLVWRDKKKALKFSSKLQSNSADVRENTSALFDAVNIIRKFENTNEKDNELNIIKDKLRKAVSEETALEKEVIDSLSLSIQRKKDTSLLVYSSPSLSLPKDTTNIGSMQQFMDEIIEKAKKGSPIGTEKTWGGKVYVKTELGWRPKRRDKSGKEEDKTSKNSSKVNDINSFASKASDEQLQAAIKDKDASPEVKQAAQEELNKRNPKEENNSNIGITDALQRLLAAQEKGEIDLGEEVLGKIKDKLESQKQKKSESLTEETLDKKLDKLKEDITSKIDEKLNELNGFKKITQTYVKVDGQTIVLNMKGEDRYKAKKGEFYMESEPKESLVEFKRRVKEAFENKLKESKKDIQKQEKVEEKINKPVKKMQNEKFVDNLNEYFSQEFEKITNETRKTLAKSIEDVKNRIKNLYVNKIMPNYIKVELEEDYIESLIKRSVIKFDLNDKEFRETIMNALGEKKTSLMDEKKKLDTIKFCLDHNIPLPISSDIIKSWNGESYNTEFSSLRMMLTDEESDKVLDFEDRKELQSYKEFLKKFDNFENLPENQINIQKEFSLMPVCKKMNQYCDLAEKGEDFLKKKWNSKDIGEIKKKVDDLTQYINEHPLKENVVLNRRMTLNEKQYKKFMSMNIGDVFETPRFSSFSTQQIETFGSDLNLCLLAKKGDKLAPIDGHFAVFELLCQRGTKFKVLGKSLNSMLIEIV